MTLVNGEVKFGGWTIHVQAALLADPYGYDQPAARYDDAAVKYNDGTRAAMWSDIDCQVTHVVAEHGGGLEPIPGTRARLGRLTADLYDPGRLLDPAAPGPYTLLARPGAPVRLVAVSPTGVIKPLWTGNVYKFEHDLLTGEGRVEASDRVALFTGVDVAGWVRPAETGQARLAAVIAVMPNPIPVAYTGTPVALSGAQFSGDLWSAVVTPTGEAEQSFMWVDQVGTLRRSDRLNLPAAVAATDCDDGTSPIIYTRLTSLVEEERVVNMVIVERLNLPAGLRSRAPLKFSDNGSVAQLGAHALTETRLPLPNDDALRLWGLDVLEQRAGSQPSLSGLGVTIADVFPWVARTVAAVASLSVGSRLNVSLSSRGDPGFWAVAVAGIRHTIVPDSWEVELDVAQAPPTSELGASQQAVEVMAWA